ncbi:hemolysin family protein [Desulfuromonas acetexigens]|jgi:magnesium and cobalt transporter|uniref:HlyC/CorC family transporter n=1 Tax=Trichloromonas acetexigens TaxID=38815 RepID=A0A550JHS7_9BACT|nr:hemolysin family protein [Desulfuromonas acetexigens]TRO82760.1 HlyC/CorC family transporter [Desulfuromonas acetexigens]
MSEKDLQDLIEESEEEGIINEDEGEMLHSIFEFGETIVREVMVSRIDMVCCSMSTSLSELLAAIISSGHSRLPIYEGTADRIVGIIYAKDLLRIWGCRDEDFHIEQIMRTPYFVPETKQIEELLQEFRTQRVHMAIAIDEYGGTSGLITIEDLIEEIVGDIQDEYDLEEDELVEESPGVVLVDGRLNIEELEDYFDIEIPREKFDTVGGYLFNLFGHVPQANEEIRDGGLRMTVVECDSRKIRKVRVRRAEPEAPEEDAS